MDIKEWETWLKALGYPPLRPSQRMLLIALLEAEAAGSETRTGKVEVLPV